MHQKLLTIYLRDHHAASTGGVALAERLARQASGEPIQVDLAALADDIAADRRALRKVMRTLAIEPNHFKVMGARVVERLSRLKLNGSIVRSSPLSRVVELEALGAGIHAKRDLWITLEHVMRDEGDFGRLRERANGQLTAVERLRNVASEVAFGNGAPEPS